MLQRLPAADDEVHRMINANGYMETLKILSEQLPL